MVKESYLQQYMRLQAFEVEMSEVTDGYVSLPIY